MDLEQPTIGEDGLPIPNISLLRKVLDHIDAHPESWDQTWWATETSCGTVHCIAGHAVSMTEGVVKNDTPFVRHGLTPSSGRGWVEAGCAALGITYEEANGTFNAIGIPIPGLFSGTNTRADVQRCAEAIAARAGERL